MMRCEDEAGCSNRATHAGGASDSAIRFCPYHARRLTGVTPPEADAVNRPDHYTWLPNQLEVIQITEHMGFCLGNAIKYILRCDHKGKPIEDLRKAAWYIEREIARRESAEAGERQ